MDSERFLRATFSLSVAAIGATALANVSVDFYGVFGREPTRPRYVVSSERWTKYLHAYRYVPAGFDGALIGASISDNLDTSQIPGYRVYNACLGGGNSTEEERILSVALDHGMHLRLLLVSLDQRLLGSSGLQAGGMEPRDYYGALGSMQLVRDYAAWAGIRGGALPDRWSAFGVQDYHQSGMGHEDANVVAEATVKLPPEARRIRPDASALREQAALIERARRQGARVVGFFPPVYEPRYRALDYSELERQARGLFRSGEVVLDFNDGSHREITTEASHFIDGLHLSKAGAARVVAVLAGAAEGSP